MLLAANRAVDGLTSEWRVYSYKDVVLCLYRCIGIEVRVTVV